MRVLGVSVLLLAGVLGGVACGNDEATDRTGTATSTTLHPPVDGVDGNPVSGDDVAAIVVALEQLSPTVRIDADLQRSFGLIQLQSIGFSAEEAACVVDRIGASQPVVPEDVELGDARSTADIPPDAIIPCVDPIRFQSAMEPDMSRVPPEQLRSTLSGVLAEVLETAGFTADEQSCVVDQAVSSLEDASLVDVFGATLLPEDIEIAVGGCLTAARASDLAETAQPR